MSTVPQLKLEDPLAHLPCSTILEFKKGQCIFLSDKPNTHLYLVIEGLVKVSTVLKDDQQVIVDLYTQDDFFGESAFVAPTTPNEQATALLYTKIMAWNAQLLEELMEKKPLLAIAILQRVIQRHHDFVRRIESFAADKVPERFCRALLRFSDRLGTPREDGIVSIPPLTHETISQYIGTSREIITFNMNQSRRLGLLRYSRKEILLYPKAIQGFLSQS